ncbi:hypothetical protein GE09DRAFT_1063959 [Coniochaeta sp. 2T2.1]|nr:hypothetical protein GE09DRAFT_1063959 [Coniochaeta sp. 2T2.1]
MASTTTETPYKIHVSPDNTGLLGLKQTEDASRKVSGLLQKDMEISHHLLALYATGAPAPALQRGYDVNKGYQSPAKPAHEEVVAELSGDWEQHAKGYLGKHKYYPDFLRFFQREMERREGGWREVVGEYVFSGKEGAEEIFSRLFAGFLHPAIQFMYGLEWEQPAMIAMGLAQTAVHRDDLGPFMLEAERLAKSSSSSEEMGSIISLYHAVKANDKLAHAAKMSDANKVRDGVLVRAREEMLQVAGKVKVKPEELEERTAEMYDNAVFVAASAAFKEGKGEKFDFFLMHHVNAAPLWITINKQPWISLETKVRLLEWKIRLDLLQYAGRACPPLNLDKIKAYKPKEKPQKTPLEIISRLHNRDEDGHAIKLGRATAICQRISKGYEDREWLTIKGDDVWDKVFHLEVDSVEAPGEWVRTAGLDEAWKDIPDAKL